MKVNAVTAGVPLAFGRVLTARAGFLTALASYRADLLDAVLAGEPVDLCELPPWAPEAVEDLAHLHAESTATGREGNASLTLSGAPERPTVTVTVKVPVSPSPAELKAITRDLVCMAKGAFPDWRTAPRIVDLTAAAGYWVRANLCGVSAYRMAAEECGYDDDARARTIRRHIREADRWLRIDDVPARVSLYPTDEMPLIDELQRSDPEVEAA